MEGGILQKKLVNNCNKGGVEGGNKFKINKHVSTFIREMRVGIFFKILQFASSTKRQNSLVLKLKK